MLAETEESKLVAGQVTVPERVSQFDVREHHARFEVIWTSLAPFLPEA